MKTAKEYWISKFPNAEKDWQKTGHDDNFQVRMMEEYAKYYHEQQVKNCDLADVVKRLEDGNYMISLIDGKKNYATYADNLPELFERLADAFRAMKAAEQ